MKRFKHLFQFIQSLSKSEKRFFKLYTKLYNRQKNKNYILLFDILEKTKVYDDNLVKESITKEIPNANLGSVKAHLKEQLFTSLRLYHRNNTDELKHYDSLAMAQLLMTKGQYYYAQEILEKLEKDTLQTENHLPHIIAQTLSNRCLNFQNSRDINTIEKNIDYYEQIIKQIKLLNLQMEARHIYMKITKIVYASQFNQKKEVALKKILAEELEHKKWNNIWIPFWFPGNMMAFKK